MWVRVLTPLVVCLIASSALAAPVDFKVSYLESPDPDTATCQIEVSEKGVVAPLLAQSEEFPATKTNQPREVLFSAVLASAVPDAEFDIAMTCKDEAGQRSPRSNVATVQVPQPPNLPPGAPRILSCGIKVTLADGTVLEPACIVP